MSKYLYLKVKRKKELIIYNVMQNCQDQIAQCNDHRSDIQKLTEELVESQKSLNLARTQASQFKSEKIKLQNEFQSKMEQGNREKQLFENSSKAQLIANEIQCAKRTEEIKALADNNLRRVILYGIDTFREFFNPTDKIDERSFQNVLEKAKNEIQRLSNSENLFEQC